MIKYGNESIKKASSTVHLGVEVVKQADLMLGRKSSWGVEPCIVS